MFRVKILACLVIFLSTVGISFSESVSVVIAQQGKPRAIIVVPNDSASQVQSAALLLSKYIWAASDARLSVVKENAIGRYNDSIKIWIGQTEYLKRRKTKLQNVHSDGFIISFPDSRNIIIAGLNDWGTEFGVYDFLERFVGVRWLLPGTVGEYIPKRDKIVCHSQEVVQSPAFLSRMVSGLGEEKVQSEWAIRNRMRPSIEFHHNLSNLFPPEKYKDNHPEFFPVRNGKRYIPPDKDKRWQPCFSAPRLAEEAIKNICDYLEKNPQANSYSLGVNDTRQYCECDKCKAKVGTKKNYLNIPDYSDLYYVWANKVAEGVARKFPNILFGCLAYSLVAEPPSTKLHRAIVPFMTYDRMKWVDIAIENQGKDLTRRWAEKSGQIGWYDYIYGTPYLLPRVYFHKMSDYLKYARQHGVYAVYAEAYPNWGEGPKMYVTLKLYWDPFLDVDNLLREWYVAAVGKKAADDLAAYYKIWEDFWTNRVKKSRWFAHDGQYLNFKKADYLDLVNYEDIKQSRRLLEAVVAKAETAEQVERAKLILKAFEYYEASATAYLGLVKKVTETGKDRGYYQRMNRRRFMLEDDFQNDPILAHPMRLDRKGLGPLRFE